MESMKEKLENLKPYITPYFYARLESNLAPYEVARLLADLDVADQAPAIRLEKRDSPQDRPEFDCRVSVQRRDENGITTEIAFDGIIALEEEDGGYLVAAFKELGYAD